MTIKRFALVDGQLVETADGPLMLTSDHELLQKKYAVLLTTIDAFSIRGTHHDLEPTRMYKRVDTIEECMTQEHQFYSGYMRSMDNLVRTQAKHAINKVGATSREIEAAQAVEYTLGGEAKNADVPV